MVDLLAYNTFRVSAKAKKILSIRGAKDIPKEPFFILGEGANVLLTHDLELVAKNEIQGRQTIEENNDLVVLRVGSGENWINLVNWTVDRGWSGIENLAFIPGTVGAAVVGNIAAYGQNFEDVVVEVDTPTKKFSKTECQFGYRDSGLKGEFVTSVTIKLSKKPLFDVSYHSRYESLLAQLGKPPYTPKFVSEAVTKLRQRKLPDWRKIGTAGSFFKNPLVLTKKAKQLQKEVSELQIYPAEKLQYTNNAAGDLVKVPAGRLLDELGWKGKRIGNVGTWPKHALTVVNFGGATGLEILDFTQQMHQDILSHFDIDLEAEVNII